MSLKGGPELRTRLKAIRAAFKPLGKDWADDTVRIAKPMIPVRTGKTRQSLRGRNATQRRATVVGWYVASFINAGVKPHTIQPKRGRQMIFQANGNTVFARRVSHPGMSGNRFAIRAAREALRRHPMAETLIGEWNKAA